MGRGCVETRLLMGFCGVFDIGIFEGRFLLRGKRLHEPFGSDHVDHLLHVVGENLQRHLGSNIPQAPHLEVCRAHPGLYRVEGVSDCRPAQSHPPFAAPDTVLHRLNQVLMFLPGDPPFLAGGAA